MNIKHDPHFTCSICGERTPCEHVSRPPVGPGGSLIEDNKELRRYLHMNKLWREGIERKMRDEKNHLQVPIKAGDTSSGDT